MSVENGVETSLLTICAQLGQVATCLVAHGTATVVCSSDPDLSSHSIFAAIERFITSYARDKTELNRNCRCILRIISLMIKSLQHDLLAGAFTVLLLTKLIVAGLQAFIPSKILGRAFGHTFQTVLEILQHPVSPVRIKFSWADEINVLSLIDCKLASCMEGMLLNDSSESSVSKFSPITHSVLRTFLTVMNCNADPTGDASNSGGSGVVYHTIVGPTATESCIFENTLLMDIPVAQEAVKTMDSLNRRGEKDFIVALFDCSLELPTYTGSSGNGSISGAAGAQMVEFESDTRMSSSTTGSVTEESSAEYQLLDAFADLLYRRNVRVVGCQKRVHPYLQRKLRALQIVCIGRISVRFMGALQRLSGARQLGSISAHQTTGQQSKENSDVLTLLDPACLGYLRSIRQVYLFGKSFVKVEGYTAALGESLPSAANNAGNVDDGNNGSSATNDALRFHLQHTFRSHLPSTAAVEDFAAGVAQRLRSCATVVLTAPTERAASALRPAYEDTVQFLKNLSSSSSSGGGLAYVLPGAGMWQAYLAQQLSTSEGYAPYYVDARGRLQARKSTATGKNSSAPSAMGNPNKTTTTTTAPATVRPTAPSPQLPSKLPRPHRQLLQAAEIYSSCLLQCALIASGDTEGRLSHCRSDDDPFSAFILPGAVTCATTDLAFATRRGDCVPVFVEYNESQLGNKFTFRINTSVPSAVGHQPAPQQRQRPLKLESYAANLAALRIATEAACALLDVDEILLTYDPDALL